MSWYLCSYLPLIDAKGGAEAIKDHGILPYVDHSSRREPDFENEYPSITALCRGPKFAPRLKVGDVIVYITIGKHKLTAVLEVGKREISHEKAKTWYRRRRVCIPSNCMASDGLSFELSSKSEAKVFDDESEYLKRSEANGDFLICQFLFKNLKNPPSVKGYTIGKKKLNGQWTQNPSNKHEAFLKEMLGKHIRKYARENPCR